MARAPLKRARAVTFPGPQELPRSKSTRDALVAPLKPSTRSTALRDLLFQAQDRQREEWEDEGSSDEELIKAIEKSNRHLKSARWEVPESRKLFDMAELDDWEDDIVWGPGQQKRCVDIWYEPIRAQTDWVAPWTA